jgi:DNA-binding MarR family transcriptional regulator
MPAGAAGLELDNKCYNTYTPPMSPTLQAELGQRKPFSSLEHEAVLSLARTAAMLDHSTAETLKEHGLTPTQYNALRILRGAGAEGLCRNEVRDRLVAQVPDTTRLLDRLSEMGLVVRAREGDDRRFVRTRITQAGLALLEPLDRIMAALHRRQLGHLGREKLRRLIRLLEEARARE